MHIALKLHKRFLHRVGTGLGALLAFHHRERDAIHEQHDVRNDERLHAARCIDAELVDGVKLVALGMLEIDQAHHRVALAGQFIRICLRFEQQRLNGFIGFKQRAVRLAQQLAAQVFELAVSQPCAIVIGAVDCPHRCIEYIGQQPLAEVGAQAGRSVLRHPRALIDHVPALFGQLLKERLFDLGIFAHGLSANTARCCRPFGVKR